MIGHIQDLIDSQRKEILRLTRNMPEERQRFYLKIVDEAQWELDQLTKLAHEAKSLMDLVEKSGMVEPPRPALKLVPVPEIDQFDGPRIVPV
jgi:hypothetical protein